MPLPARTPLFGLLVAASVWSLAPAASASDTLNQDQQQQVLSVMASAGNGLESLDRVLLQVRTARHLVAGYQNPKSPDPVVQAANTLETNLVLHLEQEDRLIKKDLAFAGNLLGSDGEYQALTDVVNALNGVDRDLQRFQDALAHPDVIAARHKSQAHLLGFLGAWSAAHPGADAGLLTDIRTFTDPQQLEDVLQSQRMIIAQVVDVLNANKSSP
jgi:hypothetical protein